MDDISFGGLQKALSFPDVVRDMVSSDSKLQRIFRYPKVRQNTELIILIQRRKYQHEGCNIRCGRKVQTTIADTALQGFFIDLEGAGIPFLHWHPADSLLDPLIEPKLPKGVLLTGILLGRFTGSFDFIDTDCNTERRVCFLPDIWVRPVIGFIGTVDDRIEGRVNLSAF